MAWAEWIIKLKVKRYKVYKESPSPVRGFWYTFIMTDDHVSNTIATYNKIAHQYAQSLEAFTPVKDRALFLTYLRPYSKLLDVGCAAGRDSIFFSKKGHTTTGVDLSKNLLEIAHKKAPELTFIHGDIRNKLFKEESFDAVWACAVLLHLKREEVLGVLKNFCHVLVTNGLLYICVKEGRGERDVKEELSNGQSRHFTYFTLSEIQRLIKTAGFHIEKAFRSNEKDRDPALRDLWWITVIARK